MIWIVENVVMALKAIIAHKLRSLLTMFGVIIGILSVSLMGTAISGINHTFEKSMSFLGNNVINIDRFPWDIEEDWLRWKYANRPNLKKQYVDKIIKRSRYTDYAIPNFQDIVSVKFKKCAVNNSEMIGTDSRYQTMFDLEMENGRFFSPIEEKKGLRVAVIGYTVKEKLFKEHNPIGNKIEIDGLNFTVIGCLKEQGKFLGIVSMDNQVFIPFNDIKAVKSDIEERLYISVKMKKDADKKIAEDELRMIMREIRGLKPFEEDDFFFNQQEIFREQLNKTRYSIAAAGLGITSLSLLVGGIGIMNIMFVSIRERTQEIGIRKALGATRNKILFQFLCEAISISLIGGIIGILITIILVDELNKFLIASLSFKLILISLLISCLTGILSGALPARHAASLDPVEAMRFE